MDFVKFGSTSNLVRFTLKDKTTGQGKKGLTGSTTGLIISTIADNEASATTYTQAAAHIQTIATLGTYAAPSASNCRFGEVDSTNHPGLYEFQFADARFAVASSKRLTVSVNDAENTILDTDYAIELVQFDPFDTVRLGLTALPNVASGSAGAIPTTGTGANQINVSGGIADANIKQALGNAVTTVANGILDINAKNINNVSTSAVTTINANQGTTQPVNFTGAGASALVKSDMTDIAGAAVSTTTAQIGVNAVQINAVSTSSVTAVNANQGTTQPVNFTGAGASALAQVDTRDFLGQAVVLDANNLPQVDVQDIKGTASVGTAGSVGIDWAQVSNKTSTVSLTNTTISSTQTITSVSGSVGSVTGAVGSVTGNVGGNVVGSVASVTGAVGSVTGNVGGNVVGSVASVTGAVGSVTAAVTVDGTSVMTESYSANGANFTLAQGLYEICQNVSEFAIAATTKTVKKRDHATTAVTGTLNSATNPTSITRAT